MVRRTINLTFSAENNKKGNKIVRFYVVFVLKYNLCVFPGFDIFMEGRFLDLIIL